MTARYYVPTRLVHGPAALGQLPELIGGLYVSHPLVVTDRNIAVKLGKAARDDIDDDTVIECGNGHALTVAEAVRIYEGCMADA